MISENLFCSLDDDDAELSLNYIVLHRRCPEPRSCLGNDLQGLTTEIEAESET